MKNSTLLLLGTFLFSGMVSAQQRFTQKRVKSNKIETTYTHPTMQKDGITPRFAPATQAESTSVWKPLKETAFEYMEGDWLEYATMDYTYDDGGNIITNILDDGETKSKTTSKYDRYNNLTETIIQIWGNGAWVNAEKKEYAYDDVVTDYQIASSIYTWDADKNDWITNYSHKKVITRNENGYVTSLSIQLLGINNKYDELERTVIVYTDGKYLPATTWTYYKLDYNDNNELEFMEMTKYDNMKWETTDGQILETNENFMSGNNRLKSAKIYDLGVETAKFEASYPEGNKKRDYDATISSITGPDQIIRKLTELDDNGSYIQKYIESLDENGDGIIEEYEEHILVMYDDHKNVVAEEGFAIMEGIKEQMDGRKVEYTYGTHDETLQYVDSAWNPDLEIYEPMMKIVGSNYTEIVITSIEHTQADNLLNCHVENNHLSFSLNGANRYAIYNVYGAQIMNQRMDSNTASVDLSSLPSGVYILTVNGNKENAKAKFIKK